ncbi:MAG: hypothetical protein HYY30_00065 [Chloroflexi bacterium]|nr:hypothetical protein [Chloroflexota bacterium]
MSRLVRKQIYIEPEQEELLKRQARQLGVSEAELIRRGIDEVSRASIGMPPEQDVWEEEKAYIRERRLLKVPQTGRCWTRDELYDDRLERFSR